MKQCIILFGSKTRHLVNFTDKNAVFEILKDIVNPDVVNAIYCDLPTLAHFQNELVSHFPRTKFWHCKNFITDITNKNEQLEIITAEHNRAHRAAQENVKQILRDFFPKINKLASVENAPPLHSS